MNFLKVLTKPETPTSYIVYWTNTVMVMRGALRVAVPVNIEDAKIVAELYALQYLLEVKEAVGNNSAGHKDIKLIVSSGAIRKLSRKDSAKQMLADYSTFLTTRFKGCPIEVEKAEDWIDTTVEPPITLDASTLMDEKIFIHGVGEVVVTSHVVEQYYDRFIIPEYKKKLAAREPVEETDDSKPLAEPLLGDAWRKLRKIAGENNIREIEKDNPNTKMKYALRGKQEGRYYVHSTQGLILVVAKNSKGQPALVTVYPVAD